MDKTAFWNIIGFEERQRRIHMMLEGLQIISIADDILVPGCGTTDAEARIDHDQKLIAVLERFEKHKSS